MLPITYLPDLISVTSVLWDPSLALWLWDPSIFCRNQWPLRREHIESFTKWIWYKGTPNSDKAQMILLPPKKMDCFLWKEHSDEHRGSELQATFSHLCLTIWPYLTCIEQWSHMLYWDSYSWLFTDAHPPPSAMLNTKMMVALCGWIKLIQYQIPSKLTNQ